MTRTRTSESASGKRARTVSRPHDPSETQADKAAEVVARGGSVTGWSFGSVPVEHGVHRQEKGKSGDDEKLKEAAKKAGEAALETKAGKQLQEKVKDTPLVKQATKFLDTTAGKVVAGGAVAAGVGGLAAAKQPLPFQAPAIPLDKITPGLSAKVTVEGPLNSPTFVGLSLTYKEQAKGGKKGPSEKERYAAETARIKQQAEMFKPQEQRDRERADEQAAVAAYVASQQKRFGTSTLIPLRPADKPKTVEVPAAEPAEPEKKEEAPVQREPATTAEHAAPGLDTSGVDGAVRGGGRALDPSTRRSMEARFGYDFSGVRIHDDAQAASAAAGVRASAFTVGEDIVFGTGRYDTTTPRGRHLLAHELAHVVQQRGSAARGGGERLHRRSVLESIGIWLGLEEGTWSDQELRAYLDAITKTGRLDGSYDADNKARAIVAKWKQSAPGWDLLGQQKALLIDEMLDGPTLDGDEKAILDLLELSDAADVGLIFADAKKRITDLDANIDDDNRKRLDTWVASRFKGGRQALLAGTAEVVGDPVPVTAPRFAFDKRTFDARLDSDRSSVELIALVERFTPADRAMVLDHLLHDIWPPAHEASVRAQMAAVGKGTDETEAIMDKAAADTRREAMSERIVQHLYLKDVPGTKNALAKGTKPVDPALAERLKEVLKPQQFVDDVPLEANEEPEEKEPEKKPKAAGKPPEKKKAAKKPVFHDEAKYKAEIKALLPKLIDDLYARVGQEAGKAAGMDEIERIAEAAKDETDLVFGQFYEQKDHPPLRAAGKGGNLHSWSAQVEASVKLVGKKAQALAQLRYYFQSDDSVRFINDRYDAEPAFDRFNNPLNKEAKALRAIADELVKDQKTVDKLVDTDRGWGGAAQGKDIFVDLFHKTDPDADRRACWDMFQTLVHEYMHTLVSKKYEDYAKRFGTDSPEWNTLIEGIDCVLAEVVWQAVVPKLGKSKLREAVEGKQHAKLPPLTIGSPSRYASYAEGFRLAEIVGIRNIYAAYFLGLVDRVSVPKGTKAPKPKGGTP